MDNNKNILRLLFRISAGLNKYSAEIGSIPVCSVDYKIFEIRKKFADYNGKFVNGGKLTKDEIINLEKIKNEVESTTYERLFE